MELYEHLKKARAAQSVKAKQRRDSQLFEFDWRSTGSEHIVGWAAAAAALQLKETTLAVRLSQSHGKYTVSRVNPQHGELDVLIVTRVATVKEPTRKRGRPAKQVDWERLGPEAPGYASRR